jgi:hypothetical protein
MSDIQTFDPVLFSIKENEFLLSCLGKPPVVVMRDVPVGVNPTAIKPIVSRVYELQELDKHEGIGWVGVESVKATIEAYLRENAKWLSDKRRSKKAPRFPSLYSFDAKGRPHLGGPGSDSGRVRSYFNSKGERVPFEVNLQGADLDSWTAPTISSEITTDPKAGLFVNAEKNRIECGVEGCGHSEKYKNESRASFNAARARISKHLRKPGNSVETHMEIYSQEFGS